MAAFEIFLQWRADDLLGAKPNWKPQREKINKVKKAYEEFLKYSTVFLNDDADPSQVADLFLSLIR